MTIKRQQVGKAGEAAAKSYLEQQGYQITEINYRCSFGEIDIIARDKDTLVFVEVRTKTSLSFGCPEESITAEKARRLKRLASSYLQSHRHFEMPSRIDLVAVILDRDNHAVLNLRQIKGILA
jgi:putative endonuclease